MDADSFTAADIEREHREALASLTPEQKRALARLAKARQRTNLNGRFPQDNLNAIFAAEAEARNEGCPDRPPHPAQL